MILHIMFNNKEMIEYNKSFKLKVINIIKALKNGEIFEKDIDENSYIKKLNIIFEDKILFLRNINNYITNSFFDN